jgi:hypothetical protein
MPERVSKTGALVSFTESAPLCERVHTSFVKDDD